MAAKIQSKYTVQVLHIQDNQVFVENDDTGEYIPLISLFADFDSKDVKLSIAYGEELA